VYPNKIKETENDRSIYTAPPPRASAVDYARIAADIDRII